MWNNNQWTQYATKDAMRIGIAMRATETGRAVFNDIVSNPTEIQLSISQETKINNATNSLIRGEFVPGDNDIIVVDGKFYAKNGTITIYEGSINAEINGSISTAGETSKLIKSLPAEIAVDGAIGSVGVHEGTHLSPKNIKQQFENSKAAKNDQPLPHNIEIDPIKIQNQYLEELNNNSNRL